MKNLFTQIFKGILVTGLIFTFTLVQAQTKISSSQQLSSDFLLSVQNLNQTASNTLEFDVYLLNVRTAGAQFQLATMQLGLLVNSNIHTGGTLTFTPDNTNSGIIPSLQFIQAPNNVVEVLTSLPTQTLIRQQGNIPPGAGRGSIISNVAPGTLVTHYIITSSVNFTPYTTPNLIFISDSDPNMELYNTSISEYILNVNTNLSVTPGVDAIVNGNPVLNVATGIDENKETGHITIYSQNKAILVNSPLKTIQVSIYSTLGTLIKKDNNVSGMKTFNLNAYPNACYLVKIVTGHDAYTQKVLLKN